MTPDSVNRLPEYPCDQCCFPELISDEAAFALSEALHWLALVCDEKYFGQIRHHIATLNEAEPIDPERPWNQNPPAE